MPINNSPSFYVPTPPIAAPASIKAPQDFSAPAPGELPKDAWTGAKKAPSPANTPELPLIKGIWVRMLTDWRALLAPAAAAPPAELKIHWPAR